MGGKVGRQMGRFELPLAVLGVLVCSYLFFNHRNAEDDSHAALAAAQTNAMSLLQKELVEAASTRERLEEQLRSGFEKATAALAADQKAQTEHIDDRMRISGELVHSQGESVMALGQSTKELEERVDGKMLQAVSTLREELGKHAASLSSVKLEFDNMAVTIADLQERYDSVKEVTQGQGMVVPADTDLEPAGELKESGQRWPLEQWPLQQPAAAGVITPPPPPLLSSQQNLGVMSAGQARIAKLLAVQTQSAQQQVLGVVDAISPVVVDVITPAAVDVITPAAVDVITPAAVDAVTPAAATAMKRLAKETQQIESWQEREAHSQCASREDKSQWKEGLQIFQWFYNNPQPTSPESPDSPRFYIEMGALDGETLSNTFMLEKCAGWHGLLIEPSLAFHKISNFRSNESNIILNQAICGEVDGRVKFTKSSADDLNKVAVSGRPEFFADNFALTFHENKRPDQIETVDVPCNPMAHILEKNQITHIDFWSLDVEGGEVSVLQTVDFTAVEISVILIENAEDDESDRKRKLVAEMHEILKRGGMQPLARVGPRKLPYKSEVWVSNAMMKQIDRTQLKCLNGTPTEGVFLGQAWEFQCFV